MRSWVFQAVLGCHGPEAAPGMPAGGEGELSDPVIFWAIRVEKKYERNNEGVEKNRTLCENFRDGSFA